MKEEFLKELLKDHQNCKACISPAEVDEWFGSLMAFLFPDLAVVKLKNIDEVNKKNEDLKRQLSQIVSVENKEENDRFVNAFFSGLTDVHSKIKKDIKAMLAGDPAARSEKEIIISYPGFHAIASYRIANALFNLNLPIIPRLLTENAHKETGIDIHPGASIGEYFCIDHGTGIVIGETSVIGNNVKLYQGVTLGALSVRKEDADSKRHPTLEDNVVVYASATILGGKTIIGEGSVIGGNVWITRSIPKNAKVYYKTAIQNEGGTDLDIVTIITED